MRALATLLALGLTACAVDEAAPAGDVPAADAEAPPPVDAGPAGDPCGAIGRRVLRRLTHEEYGHTIRDVLGLDFDAAAAFGADPRVDGFSNNTEALQVTGLLADQYRLAAEELAGRVALDRFGGCADAGCARLVRDLGRRLFRRPLTAEEAGRYTALARAAEVDPGRVVVAALLQSPHFLYRAELGRRDGDDFALTPYELATALAYLLWRSAPDDALLAEAERGALLDADARAATVARMLADPRATRSAQAFVRDWLGLERLAQVNRDPETYPTLTPALRASMGEETDRVVAALWAADAGLAELLAAPWSSVDDALAAHYGLPPVGPGFHDVERPDGHAAGVLTHASVLTTWALPRSSSPIHRGLFVRERLLCQHLPPPPANLDTSPPAVDPSRSTRERYRRHSEDPNCGGCHGLIDPIGFAFEHYDGIGRYREQDGAHPVDATGEITGSARSNGTFDGAGELARHLAASPDVAACHALQWLRMASGGELVPGAACAATLEGARLRGPLEGLLGLPGFTRRRGEPGEQDVPGAALTPTAPGEEPEPEPDPEPEPEPEPEVGAHLTLQEQSRWETGYCADGHVTHDGDAPITWEVEADIEGTIVNLWNAVADGDSGTVRFSGMDYNATIGPGQAADFGFCARLD